VLIGIRIREIRHDNPGYRGGTFMAAVHHEGINLTSDQVSCAQWWAQLPPEQRNQLHSECPNILMPTSFQVYCRKNRPEWAKTERRNTSERFESKKKDEYPVKRRNVSDCRV
jgi:hypothetical protein